QLSHRRQVRYPPARRRSLPRRRRGQGRPHQHEHLHCPGRGGKVGSPYSSGLAAGIPSASQCSDAPYRLAYLGLPHGDSRPSHGSRLVSALPDPADLRRRRKHQASGWPGGGIGMNYLARVNPKYFAAIELYAAKNDIRYYLNGVRIEPHPQQGAVIVATNGYRLAAIHDPDGWCEEPIIVGDIPRSLVAACKAKDNELTFTTPKQLWVSKTSAVVMGCDDTEPPQDPFNPMALHATRITLI